MKTPREFIKDLLKNGARSEATVADYENTLWRIYSGLFTRIPYDAPWQWLRDTSGVCSRLGSVQPTTQAKYLSAIVEVLRGLQGCDSLSDFYAQQRQAIKQGVDQGLC